MKDVCIVTEQRRRYVSSPMARVDGAAVTLICAERHGLDVKRVAERSKAGGVTVDTLRHRIVNPVAMSRGLAQQHSQSHNMRRF